MTAEATLTSDQEADEREWDLDLGDNHKLAFTAWKPDRALNPQYAGLPDTERLGAIIRHLRPNGEPHEGIIIFDSEVARKVFAGRPMWQVESWEPLTCSPSVACSCGDHGFIRGGRWVRA